MYESDKGEPAVSPSDLRILDKPEALDHGLLSRLFAEVLSPSFPPEELGEPWPDGRVPKSSLLVAWDADCDDLLGCSIGKVYPRSQVLLLRYLAVKPRYRNRGIGTALMRAVVDRWFKPETVGLVEIEDPRYHSTDDNYGDPWARLRFYQRFNTMAFAAAYFQPSLDPGFPRAYHLLLCRLFPRRIGGQEFLMNGKRVQSFLREYFEANKGEGALDDVEVRWLLDFYSDSVELVTLSELERIPDPEPPSRDPLLG